MPPAFSWPVRVYWEDTDGGGVVYYANYLKFFERTRTEWLRSMGLNQQALRDETGGVFVVSEAAVKYHRSARLDDLRIPPNNRLEALHGDRNGLHSIRIYDQWRVCFCFVDGDAYDVEIVDYH